MLFVTNLTWNSFTVKRMLRWFRQCFLTLLLLIYNLEVSFNFHLTFLQLNVKCSLCSPHSQLSSSSSRYLERFSISLEAGAPIASPQTSFGVRLKDVCGEARAPNDNFRKISVRKTIWDLEFSEHLSGISCLPASPRIFELQKNGIIGHF